LFWFRSYHQILYLSISENLDHHNFVLITTSPYILFPMFMAQEPHILSNYNVISRSFLTSRRLTTIVYITRRMPCTIFEH
jgi:hypothetical protein